MVLGNDYIGSVCTVKTMQNEILFKGKILKMAEGSLDIADAKDDPVPMFAFGVQVKLEIPGGNGKFKILTGKTYISNSKFLRIANPSTMSDFDKRLYFRMKVSNKVSLFIPSAETSENTEDGEMLDVQMLDLSLGGFQFTSDRNFKVGLMIYVTIDIMDKEMLLQAKIKRNVPGEHYNTFNYGCEFIGIRERQQDFIYKYLLKMEMEERQKKNEKQNKQ